MGLQQVRKERGLTFEALGYLAHLDIATISRVERGIVEPRRETVVQLAKALGMSVGRLVRILEDVDEAEELGVPPQPAPRGPREAS